MKKLFLIAIVALLTSSCNSLSKEAKQIVGNYYNTEISQSEPVMELNKDATCLIRAIKPGVLTYSVEGEWNVERDSLVIELDPSTVKFEGDGSLIGEIPTRSARKIVDHSDFNLQLEQDGISYLFQRRTQN